jgi:hypothetical protein
MKEQLLNQLKEIKARTVNLTDDEGSAVVPKEFDEQKYC